VAAAGVESPGSSPTAQEERLLALSRELREDLVEALVAEGERVWTALASNLAEHISRIEGGARGDLTELERKIRQDVEASLPGLVTKRFDEVLDDRIAEVANRELEAASERIATMLVIQRRQTHAYIARELEAMREELQPKVVIRRTERAAGDLSPAEQQS
jgi:hypothetical protein